MRLGVLAIAAAQLGWDPVLALDYDPVERRGATRQRRGQRRRDLRCRRHDLRVDPVASAPTGAANLLATAAAGLGEQLARRAGVAGTGIASGLLVGEADAIAAAFAAVGLVESERRESGDWAALLLHRTP